MNVQPENNVESKLVQDNSNIDQNKIDTNLVQSQQENVSQEETVEEKNWRAFREARKKDRLEKEEAERRAAEKEAEAAALKAAMEAAFSKQNYNQQNYPNQYEEDESDDIKIEKKVAAALAKKEAELEQQRREREKREYPNKLLQAYPDFNYIVNQETLDYLEFHYPEVSRPLQRLGEGFEKWSDIYQAIRKFVPNASTAKKDLAKAESNINKPKSMSSISTNPTGQGTAKESLHSVEQRRAERWLEMKRIMNGV